MAIGPTKPATPEAQGRRVSPFEDAATQHPASVPTPEGGEARLEAGALVADRYRIVRVLGEGGMGVVYAAEHVLMRKEVALKVLHADMCENAEVVARFEREAFAASHIDHPNIAGATDFGRLDGGACYLVLELLRGPSLRDEIKKGPIAYPRALRIVRGIATGVAAAHAKGVIHRDLKPENVMLVERDGDPDFVKILDFGIAKLDPHLADPGAGTGGKILTRLGTVFGTPEYMAPEQAVGDVVDARADLYALGVILLEAITGTCPFEGNPLSILRDRIAAAGPPDLSGVPDEGARALLARLLAKAAADRVQTAAELIEELDALVGSARRLSLPGEPREAGETASVTSAADAPATTTSASTAPSSPPRPARRWLYAAVAPAALLAGAAGFFLLMRAPGEPTPPASLVTVASAPIASAAPATSGDEQAAAAASAAPAAEASGDAPEPAATASAPTAATPAPTAARAPRRPVRPKNRGKSTKLPDTLEKLFK